MVAVGDEVPMNVHETDERLGSDLQTLTTPELMFRVLLTKDGAQRLELART
jgi:hypothetical protein